MEATRDGYGRGLLKYANGQVVVLNADLGESCKTKPFVEKFPERSFNFGVAEQDMICAAAGLASCGKTPFTHSFAIFTQRAFEQIRNQIARNSYDVKIIGSHAGLLTGEDGESAQAIADIALFRAMPNFVVINPCDSVEAEKCVEEMVKNKVPFYLRLVREKTTIINKEDYKFQLGKGVLLKDGKDICIIGTGPILNEVLKASKLLEKDGKSVRVVNIHTIKPIDKDIIIKAAKGCKVLFTVEDHNIIGGLGSAVSEVLSENYPKKIVRIGLNDTFGETGSPKELYDKYGLSAEKIYEKIKGI